MSNAICEVCFRHCSIPEGGTGFCGGRTCKGNKVVAANYGRITSIALDPIEKKPLARFHPGSLILSVGSYGCNLRCPFCQNNSISWSSKAMRLADRTEYVSPDTLAEIAESYRKRGNIGVAFTYNEPLIGYEFVLDTAKKIHARGMKNVMVTNGTAELTVLRELLPYIDAMNIDLKGFTEHYYSDILDGSLKQVLDFIEEAAKGCHVELTTLIIPQENDSVEEMREMTAWIAALPDGENIPLHISRFFPQFHMTDRDATDVSHIYHLAEIAREKLKNVYTGNC